MKVSLTINGKQLMATLANNPTAKDFYTMLPLRLSLKDYASTEKIAYLERKLTKADAPAGTAGKIGDITYYALWGNLAIFYRDFGYAAGLITLGRLSGDISLLSTAGDVEVLITPVEP
ncbi:cyclophilin-like fold protein [Shewanella sp. Isolate11]|uniref:cyclophilin-like fold protein n=1 Tax=Shewanella sp. Isolate11 TaxID=2908530 RepID=UPI001EFCB284|nr:cyclophilin-like fold protein [Shewanella sp. Isolate11]MCG9698348.1 hypothetical protein [Shewanella sp. Isolate11]